MKNEDTCPCKSGKTFGECCGPIISGAIKAPHTIDPNKCIKCGLCMDNCRFGAISKS